MAKIIDRKHGTVRQAEIHKKTQGPHELYAYKPCYQSESLWEGAPQSHIGKAEKECGQCTGGYKTVPAVTMNDTTHKVSNATRLHHKNRIWLTWIRTKFDVPEKLIKRSMKVRDRQRQWLHKKLCMLDIWSFMWA